MTFIDFHTHHVPAETGVVAVVDGCDTWGIHPWRADEPFSVPDLSGRIALGECGLDAVRGAAMERQEAVFRQHIALSEQERKPLVIHCVRAIDRLLRLRREQHPTMPWMLHGFRGKPQQLMSLLGAGFYVSFGLRHNAESLRLCPLDRLMLETDDEKRPIADLYNNVAELLGISLPFLCSAMAENYLSFFQKKPFQT